ncbi:MAG: nitrilase-related carbon-nitrogen hydrolase [Armatimonadota bacterium]
MKFIGNWLAEKGIAAHLHLRGRAGMATQALANQSMHPGRAEFSRDQVTVGMVQMQIGLVLDATDYALKMYRLVRDAVAHGAQLVVFPEYTSLPLLGLLPHAMSLSLRSSLSDALEGVAPGAGIGDVFTLLGPTAQRIYTETFSALAKGFNIYLMAGTIILPGENGGLYNTAYLFGPDGKTIGTQRKLHLFTLEEEWMDTGHTLQVFDLPFGRVAMPVCMDHTYWETARLAYINGAEILLDPAAGGSGDQQSLAARGVRMRVQESPCYGVHVYGVTELFDLHWRGPSSVYAPVGLTPDGHATLARAKHPDAEELVICPLNMAALRAHRTAHPLDFNTPLYEKYLPRLYGEYRKRMQGEKR